MNMQDIAYNEHLAEMTRVLTSRGLLLTSKGAQGKANSMLIGWGLIGSVWGKPVWTVLVRPSRYTYDLIEQCGEFTVSVPGADLQDACTICGSQSGRSQDKLAAAGLQTMPGRTVTVPVIDGCIIHYECRVLHSNDILPGSLVRKIADGAYPNGDYHRVYWGEILAAYADMDRVAELRA